MRFETITVGKPNRTRNQYIPDIPVPGVPDIPVPDAPDTPGFDDIPGVGFMVSNALPLLLGIAIGALFA